MQTNFSEESCAVPDVFRKLRDAAGYMLLIVDILWILPSAWLSRTFLYKNCSAGSKRLQRETRNAVQDLEKEEVTRAAVTAALHEADSLAGSGEHADRWG